MIKKINQLFTRKHIELTIGNLGRLLEINRLLPDDFSHIDFKYYYLRSIEMSDHSFSEIMNIPDLLNLKFIEISNSFLLSPDEFQFLWKVLSSKNTRFNLTRINLKFNLLSECLTVLSLCSDCPELKSVLFKYWEADAENEDEAVEQAQREFRQKFGFIQTLIIGKEKE